MGEMVALGKMVYVLVGEIALGEISYLVLFARH
jgi:hypothetical protein